MTPCVINGWWLLSNVGICNYLSVKPREKKFMAIYVRKDQSRFTYGIKLFRDGVVPFLVINLDCLTSVRCVRI